jgi:protein phosphatase
VADGVGGGRGGEAAARNALTLLPGFLLEALAGDRSVDALPGKLTTAVMRCHTRLGEIADQDPALAGMATTLTLWLGLEDHAYVVQVGDSRCYRLRAGELECLTRDQTMAQELLDQGLIETLEQAPAGWTNILTSALGSGALTPAIHSTDRRGGDVLLICSDGIMKHLEDSALGEVLREGGSARSLSCGLVDRGVADGGLDNITAVVLREPV